MSASEIMSAPEAQRVDSWELRCRFNRARYWARAQSGEFEQQLDRENTATKDGGPAESIQEQWILSERTSGNQIARFSRFLDKSGREIRQPDPKDLTVNGIRYRLKKGAKIVKEPELGFSDKADQLAYKRLRRWLCRIFGESLDAKWSQSPRLIQGGMWLVKTFRIGEPPRYTLRGFRFRIWR